MYGKDVDRCLMLICGINNETAKQINLLAREADYRIETIDHSHRAIVTNAPHDHPDGTHTHFVHACREPTDNFGNDGPVSRQLTYPEEYGHDEHWTHPHVQHSIIYERQHPCPAAQYVGPISSIRTGLDVEVARWRQIDWSQYTPPRGFNVTYGSPWTEFYDLHDKIGQMEQYAASYPNLQWIGEKQSLLSLMGLVYTVSVDAKYALTIYQDWIQRAYDNQFNHNRPDITWEHFDEHRTIGNRKQHYIENVKVPYEPNPAPF